MPKRRVVILGAGLAGYCLARAFDRLLAASREPCFEVLLVSPSISTTLAPLLNGLVAGWIEPWQMRVPLLGVLRRVKLIVARALSIDPQNSRVLLDGPGVRAGCDPAPLAFDDLVIACGTASDCQAVRGAQDLSIPLRTIHDAYRLRNRLDEVLEAASGEDSSRRRRALTSVVVVGSDHRACSAALAISKRYRLVTRYYPRLENADPRVLLVSADEQLCNAWGATAAKAVRSLLDRSGVEVLEKSELEAVLADHVQVRSPDQPLRIDARTVLWTSCSSPQPLLAGWEAAPLLQGRLRTDEHSRVLGSEHVYALGDCACTLPGIAVDTPAILARHARWLAATLASKASNQPLRPRPPIPFGDGLLLDQDQGLGRVGKQVQVSGLAAWFARRAIAAQLPTLRQRTALNFPWLRGAPTQNDPSRIQPEQRVLYLTPGPVEVAPKL